MKDLNEKELKTINGGSQFGYYLGYYWTKGMTKIMDGIDWVNEQVGL
ncbi:bacteriocin-type signal sequence-containing protein [Saccharicrinis carchari]|uniref:Bacteriocin-type signal sequence-containing protein n=1 Tax=Saccharicrinis carchari TaxID=1168039 RepID=A0A521CMK7_SACCC|nr:bacteriocin [Saccharicrinis carchari]SMO59920.1 bacteriocin-type signal sequence-containing protein [Saccharicrinis carchari]